MGAKEPLGLNWPTGRLQTEGACLRIPDRVAQTEAPRLCNKGWAAKYREFGVGPKALEAIAHLINPEPLQALQRCIGAMDRVKLNSADILH